MDPFLALLKYIHRDFLKVSTKYYEVKFVEENLRKHRSILWINAIASGLVYLALRDTTTEAIGTVISALLAPVMVLGTAWFAMSFGGVPKKLIMVAMSTTYWMFIAFLTSLSAMFIAVGFVTSYYLWPVLGVIYFGCYTACVQYDTADGLKAGLDEAVLNHSRAMLLWLKDKEGIEPPDE